MGRRSPRRRGSSAFPRVHRKSGRPWRQPDAPPGSRDHAHERFASASTSPSPAGRSTLRCACTPSRCHSQASAGRCARIQSSISSHAKKLYANIALDLLPQNHRDWFPFRYSRVPPRDGSRLGTLLPKWKPGVRSPGRPERHQLFRLISSRRVLSRFAMSRLRSASMLRVFSSTQRRSIYRKNSDGTMYVSTPGKLERPPP